MTPGFRARVARPLFSAVASRRPFLHGRLDATRRWRRPAEPSSGCSELPQAVSPHLPTKTERHQLGPEGGTVEAACRHLPGVEVTAVRRRPPTVCALDQIGHDHVGVQLGIAGPAGAMAEGGTDESVGLGQIPAVSSSADEARLGGQVVEDSGDGPVVGGRDGVGHTSDPKAHRSETPLGAEKVRS